MSFVVPKIKRVARDWRVKVAIQNLLGLLPGNLGFKINERMTQFVRGSIEERQNAKKRYLKGIDNVRLMLDNVEGFAIKDKTVLELGTGWHGIDLVIFYLLGAEKIITIDHYPHLTLTNLVSSIKFFREPECLRGLNEVGLISHRISSIDEAVEKATSLNDLLLLLGINYEIMPSSKYKHLQIDQKSIDLFYSESVLQRVPEKHLQELFHTVSSYLSDDAVIFHRTDQSDINAQGYVDTELWAFNYLRYGDQFYNLAFSGKFNSQNRLRESDFLKMLTESGMYPIYLESQYNPKDRDRLRNFKVADRFREKSIEDISIKHSKIICLKNLPLDFVEMKHQMIQV